MRGRPCLRDQGHADAELTAEPQAGDGAVDQQVPIALCEGAKPSESGEQENGPGQHPHATVIVAEDTEQDSSRDGTNQRPGHQRAGLRRGQMQVNGNRPQHEAEDEEIEAVHRVADGGRGERFSRKRSDAFCGIGGVGLCDSHPDHPPRIG
jgi:hypothetical protein